MSGQQLGAMASAMRVVLPEQLPTPALVSREGPAQRADHVCTCLSGHPDRCSAPVHICACCTGARVARSRHLQLHDDDQPALVGGDVPNCPGGAVTDEVASMAWGVRDFVSTTLTARATGIRRCDNPSDVSAVARPQVHLRDGAGEVPEASRAPS